jgi:hypothetical protein
MHNFRNIRFENYNDFWIQRVKLHKLRWLVLYYIRWDAEF